MLIATHFDNRCGGQIHPTFRPSPPPHGDRHTEAKALQDRLPRCHVHHGYDPGGRAAGGCDSREAGTPGFNDHREEGADLDTVRVELAHVGAVVRRALERLEGEKA